MTLPSLTSLRAILLDLDDTILDDEAGRMRAWELVVECVLDAHPALAAGAVHEAIMASTEWFWSDPERHRRGRLDLDAARAEIIEGGLSALGRRDPELAVLASRRHGEHREQSQRVLGGALRALQWLRSRFELTALVTNGASAPQRAKIERFGLTDYFDHIQVEGEFGRGKPDAAVYRHVFELLGVRPREALMVGDSISHDVEGALRLGMQAVLLARSGQTDTPVENVPVITSLSELPSVIEGR